MEGRGRWGCGGVRVEVAEAGGRRRREGRGEGGGRKQERGNGRKER